MEAKTFKPSQALTFETVQEDSQLLLKLFRESETEQIFLDLSQVIQCDSAGLALLIEAKRLSKEYQKKLMIGSIPKSIYALAEFCGVEGLLETLR